MKFLTLKEEKKLRKRGFKLIACLDEAGRGPLAGPVVASAVVITTAKIKNHLIAEQLPTIYIQHGAKRLVGKPKIKNILKEIKDSKKLTSKKREEFYKILIKHPAIGWTTGRVSGKIIDKINILEATKLAMGKAIENLERKLKREKYQNYYDRGNFRKIHDRGFFGKIDFLIIDGNFTLPADFVGQRRLRRPKAEAFLSAETLVKAEAKAGINLPIPQKSIIKADEKVFSCAVASIIAKVKRDRIMEKYHQKYPQYRFDRHKGYGTKYHLKMLKKYGPCKIHRKSFWPVKKLLRKDT